MSRRSLSLSSLSLSLSARRRYAGLVRSFAPAAYWRLGDAGVAADGGYAALVAALSPVEHWRLSGATTAQTGVIAGKVLTAGASVLLEQAGAIEGVADTAVDCGAGTTSAYDLTMASDDADFDTASFSVSFWFKPSHITGGHDLVAKLGGGGGGYGWAIYAENATVTFYTKQAGVPQYTSSGSVLAIGAWTNVHASYDGTTKRLYVDGVLVDSDAVTYTNTSNDGTLRVNAGSVYGISGKAAYDELSIHSVALTDRQIMDLYLAGRPSYKLADASGNGRHAAAVGGPTFGATGALTGDTDTAVDFDGVNDYGVLPYDPALNPATFSVGGWFNMDAVAVNACLFSSYVDAFQGILIFANMSGGNSKIFVQSGTGGAWNYSADAGNGSLIQGSWQHLVVVNTGASVDIYINGALDVSGAVAVAQNTSGRTRIGAYSSGLAPFPGKLDEFFITSTVLTPTQILDLYNLGR